MLNKYISKTIKNNFPFTPTNSQTLFCDKISEYILDDNSINIFILKGYAGTGKTTTIATLVKALKEQKIRTILLAPTGRAAKVFGEYAETPAWTIHKHIYRQQSENEGMGFFSLDYNKAKNTLFIVDEVSMLADEDNINSAFGTGNLLNDLIRFVFNDKNNKLLLVGDTAQLPPVGLTLSHALNKTYINEQYNIDTNEITFTEVIRQKNDSYILHNATKLRQQISNNTIGELNIYLNNTEVKAIKGNELIEELSDAYSSFGIDETLVITRSNKRANAYNEGIRRTILYKESEISKGDFIMIVKNNYFWKDDEKKIDFIANGEIAEVCHVYNTEEIYGFRFVDIDIRLINYNLEIKVKVLLETLSTNTPALSYEQNKELYRNIITEEYPHIKNKKQLHKKIRENDFFNALQVKFAYAITCHKSQGGQWDTVFIDQGYLTDEMLNSEYYRWLYTAITRAKKRLFFVNFQEKYQNNKIE